MMPLRRRRGHSRVECWESPWMKVSPTCIDGDEVDGGGDSSREAAPGRGLGGDQRVMTSRRFGHDGGTLRDWHLERFPGKYVAIDMTTDEFVLAADTPHELEAEIRAQGPQARCDDARSDAGRAAVRRRTLTVGSGAPVAALALSV